MVVTRSQGKENGAGGSDKRKKSISPPYSGKRSKKMTRPTSSPMITGQTSTEPSAEEEKVEVTDLKMDEFSEYTPENVAALIADAEKLTSGENSDDGDVIIQKLTSCIKWFSWYNEIRGKDIPPEKRSKDELEACFKSKPELESKLSCDVVGMMQKTADAIKKTMNVGRHL